MDIEKQKNDEFVKHTEASLLRTNSISILWVFIQAHLLLFFKKVDNYVDWTLKIKLKRLRENWQTIVHDYLYRVWDFPLQIKIKWVNEAHYIPHYTFVRTLSITQWHSSIHHCYIQQSTCWQKKLQNWRLLNRKFVTGANLLLPSPPSSLLQLW